MGLVSLVRELRSAQRWMDELVASRPASLNLLDLLVNHQIGADYPEFTPVDLTALLSRFARNGIATSKVETGRQRKL